MTQLAEQPLLIPEVCGSNPVISKIYIEHLFTVSIEKTKKEAGNGPLKIDIEPSAIPGLRFWRKIRSLATSQCCHYSCLIQMTLGLNVALPLARKCDFNSITFLETSFGGSNTAKHFRLRPSRPWNYYHELLLVFLLLLLLFFLLLLLFIFLLFLFFLLLLLFFLLQLLYSCCCCYILVVLVGQPWPLFHLFLVFSSKQYNFYNKSM